MTKHCIIGQRNDIYQERRGEAFKDHFSEDVIATFDTERMGWDYIEASKLKKRIRHTYASEDVFKQRSLLINCIDAWVVDYREEYPPPHNPVL